jgi:hypothetical protein
MILNNVIFVAFKNSNDLMKRTTILILILCFFKITFATDRNFVFTYESRTLQGGLRELEAWMSYNYGRKDFYSAVQNRLEFEIGLGKKLQTSFYLNLDAETLPITVYNPVADENGNVVFEQQDFLETKFSTGFSNEWKYQLSDPSANKIGSALYGEIGISPNEYELEARVILDKRFNDFITALNLVGELEWKAEGDSAQETKWEQESKFEVDYGLVYTLPKNFSFGFEARNINVFHDSELEHSALFIGPVISYKQNNWWISFGAQPQIVDLKTGGFDLEDHEKLNARLLFSYSL